MRVDRSLLSILHTRFSNFDAIDIEFASHSPSQLIRTASRDEGTQEAESGLGEAPRCHREFACALHHPHIVD